MPAGLMQGRARDCLVDNLRNQAQQADVIRWEMKRIAMLVCLTVAFACHAEGTSARTTAL